jgi:DNA 3'-phosphatase
MVRWLMPPIAAKPKLSTNVAVNVLRQRGLEGRATVDDLAVAAKAHDVANMGYASRDELELAASDLVQRLIGAPGPETKRGITFDRGTLDGVKRTLAATGVRVTDDDVLKAGVRLGASGSLTAAQLEAVGRGIAQTARLKTIEAPRRAPPAPSIVAQAHDATDALARRKLASTFSYDGSGAVKVAFFDADSTLRVSRTGSVSANTPTDVALLPGVAEKLTELHAQGYLIAIVSNQAGVEDGHVKLADADAALRHTVDLIRVLGGEVHYVDYAETRGPDRKPNGGMFDRLAQLLGATFNASVDMSLSFMSGDSAYKKTEIRPDGRQGSNFSNSDRLFAEGVGLRFDEPHVTFGWDAWGVAQIDDLRQRDELLARFAVGKNALSIRYGGDRSG